MSYATPLSGHEFVAKDHATGVTGLPALRTECQNPDELRPTVSRSLATRSGIRRLSRITRTINYHHDSSRRTMDSSQVLGVAAAMGFLAIMTFQVLLALGSPLGRAAWGGAHVRLPTRLRAASAAAALVYVLAA